MADVVATVAVVFATCGNVVSFYGRCYCHLCWLMLLPYFLLLCFLADVISTMADGIAISETDVIGRCYLPGWQME